MSRVAAWVILVGAAILVYSLAFTAYDHLTNRYQSNGDGGLARVRIECPPPFSVLFFDAQPETERDYGSCEGTSKSLFIEAVLVAGVGLLLAWKPVTRPRPTRIDPLSEKLNL